MGPRSPKNLEGKELWWSLVELRCSRGLKHLWEVPGQYQRYLEGHAIQVCSLHGTARHFEPLSDSIFCGEDLGALALLSNGLGKSHWRPELCS